MDCKVTSTCFWGNDAEEVLVHRFPLHKACRDGDPVTLSRLVAEVSYEQLLAEDEFYSWTPIHWAAYFGKNDCLNGLLHSGVNVNIKTSKFQQTPAHVAAFGGHPGTIDMLMKSGADFHAKDYLGEIPLHKAARVGNVKCLEILILSGTSVNMCNNNGLTASQLARNQRFSECLRILEEVNQQQFNSSNFSNGSNGHSIVNGVSGTHLSNGHSHGVNGAQLSRRKRSFDDVSIPNIKKPRFSGSPCSKHSEGSISAIRHPSYKPLMNMAPDPLDSEMAMDEVNSPGRSFNDKEKQCRLGDNLCGNNKADKSNSKVFLHLHNNDAKFLDESEKFDMDFQSPTMTPTESSELAFHVDEICRAPSPGMDMNWDIRDDPQLWGHLHGYGDTAEDMVDDSIAPTPQNVASDPFPHTLRGVQARGWR